LDANVTFARREKMSFKTTMEKDLKYIREFEPLIREISLGFGLNPAIVAAVISRESGGGRLLRGPNGERMKPGQMFFRGTGDRGHGRGLMQIDDRFWKGALDLGGDSTEEDAWAWAPFNIAMGCFVLRDAYDFAEKKIKERGDLVERAALAMYNAGPRAVRLAARGGDPDSVTHGGDYGRDVMKRAGWLANVTFASKPARSAH
jgi:hypothetical protein